MSKHGNATDNGVWLEQLVSTPIRRVTVITVLALVVLLRIASIVVSIGGKNWAYDFSAYFLAAQRVATGAGLYTPAQLAGPFPPQEQFAYLYPPFLSVVMLPFNLFHDYPSAMWLWAGLEVFALVGATLLLARQRRLSALLMAVLVLAELALPQVAFEIVMGNVQLLLVGLLVLAWVGIDRGDRNGQWLAGAAIGIAALIKVFPGVLILWLIATRRFQAAAAAVVAMLALAAVTLPFVGIGAWFDYVRVLANLGPPVDIWSSIAPTTLLSEFTGFPIARVVVTGAGIAILLWSAVRRPAPISFAIALTVSVLIVPTLYPHSMSLAVAPLLIYALYSVGALGPLVVYAALFVGGQLALFDLRVVVNRLTAIVSLVFSLIVLVLTRSSAPARDQAQLKRQSA